MASPSIWDNSWVPLQLNEISSYLQSHSEIQVPPLSGLPMQIVETCQAGINEWGEYCSRLTLEKERNYAGITEQSPSLESPFRFRQLSAQRMFEATFLGLLKTRLALMWTQHSSEDPIYPFPIKKPILPEEPLDHKRTVGYWVVQAHRALVEYSPGNNGMQSITAIEQQPYESSSAVSIPSSNAGRLLTAARSYEVLSGQCRLGANILYAAWALRRIIEFPSGFLVSSSGDIGVDFLSDDLCI